ncbi:hypothetical protein [Streptomyces sp. NPDC101206]|uniref:hypothetical protein n=1 Tax=Streptomyces sp. NPDC101206 TaxID=3366128 RepID=UPI00381C7C25
MTTHGLKRRMSVLATVLGLGITVPFALASPAHAQQILSIDKSHEGNFARGGQGLYHITLNAIGEGGASAVQVTDNLPPGLTVANLAGNLAPLCQVTNSGRTVLCDNFSFAAITLTLDVTVNIANDTPCSVVNTVTATATNSDPASDSDPTTITGGDCNSGTAGNGGSLLPINLNGILTVFNNINTNNNINSPHASNTNNQTFGLNTP